MFRNHTAPSVSGVVVRAPVALIANFVVPQVLALRIFQVESVSWSNSNTSTVSVSVPAVCVATFSSLRTEPADVNVPPAPFWTEVRLK